MPKQHSPRVKRAWPRREPRPMQRGAQKQCGPVCRTRLAAEAAAQADVEAGEAGASLSGEAGHDGQPTPGSRVAAPCGARRGGVHGHLDGALTGPFQARSAGHEGTAETVEAQSADIQGGQCQGAGSVRAERQPQRRSLRPTLKAKPKGHREVSLKVHGLVPVLMSLAARVDPISVQRPHVGRHVGNKAHPITVVLALQQPYRFVGP